MLSWLISSPTFSFSSDSFILDGAGIPSSRAEGQVTIISFSLSPLERYRLQKKQERERLEKERQALIESGNLTEENDPLKKYRVSKPVRTESRVPTLKEQEILKQANLIQQKQNRSRKK